MAAPTNILGPHKGGERMVKLMRVDDRMIHGQVAIAWSKALEFKVLLVANDEAAASKTQTMALKMAGPPSSCLLYTSRCV